MRIDIEYSPGAPSQRYGAAARETWTFAGGESRMNGKRLCSICHPAAVRRERAGRTFVERTLGVLWHHSSVNLVGPRSIAPAGPNILRRLPKIAIRLASRGDCRNQRNHTS